MKDLRLYIRLIIGMGLYSIGIVMTIIPALGLAPWDAFHQGLSHQLPITLGQASITVGLVIICFTFFLNEPLGIGTLLNVILIGLGIDLLFKYHVFGYQGDWVYRILMFFTGMCVICLATWLYIGAGMGAGPRDGLMLTIMRTTKLPVSIARILVEGTATFLGFLLGGQIGLGTIAIFIIVGPMLQFWFSLVDFDPLKVSHRTIEFSDLKNRKHNM